MIEGAQQTVHTSLEIQRLIPQGLKRTIQLRHGLQLLDARREMILQGRCLIHTVAETPKQQGQTLQQPHAMDEAVLILFQPLLLVGVVEIGSLQLLQLLFLFSLLLFGALLLLLKCRQGICGLAPFGPGISHLNFELSQCRSTETVKPEPLLPRPRQQLGLSLNREINQQRPQLKQLLTVHCAAIQPTATGITITLLPFPFAADQKLLFGIKFRRNQPLLEGWVELKRSLDPGAIRTRPQQTNAAGTLRSTQYRIEGIKKDRFTGTGLTGEHRETRAELQFKTLNQSDVLQQQTGEHVQPCDDADRSGSSVRLEGVSDIPMN